MMFSTMFVSQFQAEKLVIETDDVAKGLIEVISQHRITNLVMGAAADKQYSKYGSFDSHYLNH